ncbi:hypothetical protein Dd1591_1806 [Dickeya chrysanthemi Ech1591]|uniref:Uncharacterized protein n=1 Tax=Dickeya chrysanthemi (strain Ech1591) TaxID=561229 RepID=C6CG87_DICC1|nr:hypothetical protein Dd1591_1806 [Dickeya chrysanthemi Ech1591]
MSLFSNIFFVCFIASQTGKTMASVAEKTGRNHRYYARR